MAVGLSGSLSDFSISDVFQLIGQQRKTGVLELRNERLRAQLRFDKGLVVSAAPGKERAGDLGAVADRLVRCGYLTRSRAEEAQAACRGAAQPLGEILVERDWCSSEAVSDVEDLITRDTIFEVLRWTDGSFDFCAEIVEHDRERSGLLGAEQILMDGLRMVDEWHSFANQVPTEETVFQRAGPFDHFIESADRLTTSERESAERVYQFIDGRIPVRRAIDLARLCTFDGVRLLAQMAKAGVIRALDPTSVRRAQRVTKLGLGRDAWVPDLAIAAMPLVLLALVVGWVHVGAESAPALPGQPVEVSSLHGLREAYAARSVRQAVEAHRLEFGEWPGALSELEDRGLLVPGTLAAPEARPYYSMHRDRGLVFLAPERSPRGSR